jgi:Glycosyltransferase family 9 (heptosyltransferase)
MMQKILDAFAREDWIETRRLAADALVAHDGLDLMHIAGLALMQLRDFEAGMTLLKAVVALHPSSVAMYINAAHVAEQLSMLDDLAFFTEHGLRFFPDDPTLQRQRGNLYLLRMDYPRAKQIYQDLLTINPDNVAARINLGNTYRMLTDFAAANEQFIAAAWLEPDNSLLRVARASLYGDLARVPDAIAMLEGVEDWDARYMLASFLLASGDYTRGWLLHRDRWHCLLFKGITKPPRDCDDLALITGQKIALMREGGFGDVFQFLRYVPAIAKLASEVVIHATRSDFSLLQANVPDNVSVHLTTSSSKATFGYNIPTSCVYTIALFDLPFLFNTTVDNIPATLPYMQVPRKDRERPRLPTTIKKRVGLTWAGASMTGLNERPYDAQRSIKLSEFAKFAKFAPNIEFINLQLGPRASDVGLNTTRVLTDNCTWGETAAILAQLDLVISVDTAIVHLAAAMGKPTWLLSRFNPCWRWLRNQPTSPWYPGMRVFGQTSFGNWSPIIDEVYTALQSLCLTK